MSDDGLRQRLPVEAYRSRDWFEREQREIFSRTWSFAGLSEDLEEPGQFVTVQAGDSSLIVLRTPGQSLRAFHNLCRHRGTELLEGCGKLGRAIICPYHKWSYDLEGALLGAPQQKECFPDLDKAQLGLLPASLATLRDMVFVHPDPDPSEPFAAWIATLPQAIWPHDFAEMSESGTLVYEMKCNWKIFYENAIDGYHLAYLHKDTLGGPLPAENLWEPHGRHLLWYSTEEDGRKTCSPAAVAKAMAATGSAKITGAESGDYAGVYMIYPSTIVTASPYDFAISSIVPLGPESTRLTVRGWGKRAGWLFGGASSAVGRQAEAEPITLEGLETHPMETGDFMLEDLWICEKIQRAMRSPRFSVGPLARGPGCETPLVWFQEQVLEDLNDRE